MDTTEKNDSPNIGSLFQQIVNDLKSTNPLWDDFVLKANKLHFCLKATIQALVFYLEAFQKIADAATNSKGASKEIGTALTRVCLRHKAVESRLKTFTTAIMECLIIPLQEKIEDWKKQVTVIEKERAKESKRCRLELKKSSTGTLRLQKKAKKGQTNIQSLVDSSMQDYNQRQAELDEIERKSLRAIMIEERMRYCTFVFMLQPVVKEECEVMYELGHLQEVMQSIGNVTKEPHALPQSSEQFIQDSNMSLIFYPDSPGGSNTLQPNCSSSIGSRKSSVCSINSMNSNSSGSPGHQKSTSQFVSDTRLKAGKSEDSGFRSSSTMSLQVSTGEIQSQNVSTWPPQVTELPNDNRPHTISTAYEKGHARPPLTVYTFQNPDSSESRSQLSRNSNEKGQTRPPLPIRCSSLERPISTVGLRNSPNTSKPCPSPIPLHVTKDYFQTQTQPTYANMTELTTMTSTKNTNSTTISPLNIVNHQPTSPVHSTSSLVSPDSCATNPVSLISSPDISAIDETPQCTPQTSCPQTPTVLEVDKVKAMSNIDNSFVENKDNLSEPTKYSGSVLAKATLFEQLEKKQLQDQTQLQNVISRSSISTNYSNMKEGKKEEIFKSMSALESSENHNIIEIDKKTIEELNSLIGELDTFQKEHERMEYKLNDNLKHNEILSTTIVHDKNNDNNSKTNVNLNELSNFFTCLAFDGQISGIETPNSSMKTDDIILKKMVEDKGCDSLEGLNTGFENPSFFHLNDAEVVAIRKNSFFDEGNMPDININEKMPVNRDLNFSEFGKSDEKLNKIPQLSSFKNTTMTFSTEHSSVDLPVNQCNSSNYDLETKFPNIEGIKVKPAITPRPVSLAGAPTRIARRSSVNIIKPQPPVRRSSSVTPCQGLNIHSPLNLSSQNLMTSSSESLPPPPSYLLEKNQQLGGNVAGTVRALNEMRHTPASPNVIRKTQQVTFQAEQLERKQHQETLMTYKQPHIITSFSPKYDAPKVGMFSYQLSPTSQEKSKGSGIYARPQINLGTSSFKQSGHGIFSQIAKRINPNKSNQFDSNTFDTLNQRSSNNPEKNDQHHDKQQHMNDSHQNQQVCGNNYYGTTLDDQHSKTTQIQRYDVSKYASTNPFISSITSQSSARSQPHPYNFTTSSSFQNHQSENVATQHSSNNITVDRPNTQTGSVIAKTNAGFLENLNQKLAEQRLSGKAYAVRNYINKTALPDPRVCHESLLDQIKRGAILKRNRTVNDRSAPNII